MYSCHASSRAHRALSLVALAVCGALASLQPAPAQAAWPHHPNINLPVTSAANEQSTLAMVPDGAGGMIVAWQDFRSGTTYDIYAQHILASGVNDPAWPVNGRAISTAANNQQAPVACSDGNGGAIIAFIDSRAFNFDIYAQHVLATGVVDPMWPVDGRALCAAANSQQFPTIVSDGAGGAIATWQDPRTGTPDVYAQHVLSYGAVDPAWPVDGRGICTGNAEQQFPKLCTDGAGGAIIAWADYRTGVTADVYAQHVLASGAVDPAWPTDGRQLVAASNNQFEVAIESDGSGGALVAWQDYRSGVADIYITHVYGSSILHWSSNGVALCTAANSQINIAMVRDGANGVIVTWQDNRTGGIYDIYAHHVTASGLDASWPGDGRALCTASGDQQYPSVVSDGSGGALVAWQDSRTANGVYAQHVLASGTVDGGWPVDGRALSTAWTGLMIPRAVSDGAGGLIAAWNDSRSGNSDVYAQRVARFAYLGTPEAVIASVTDVPNDNGGKVKVSWDASWLDTENDPNMNQYEIWRSVPGSVAEAAIRAGATQLAGFSVRPAATGRTFVAAAQAYWEYLAVQSPVHYIPSYAYLAPTTGDSTGSYNPKTAFMVVARNYSGSMYWLSTPVSGYSVDNVPPINPAPFTGTYGGGSAHLHWDPNAEPDLAGYRLYRGASPGFTPGPGNLVASPSDTGYVDPAAAPFYYKLSAVDIHGNESGFSLLLPSGTLAVGNDATFALALARPSPNPALGPTMLRWSLPRDMRVSLAVFDAAGRRLRLLEDGVLPAGAHSTRWDLRDDRGSAVASGLCFVRLTAGGRVLVERLITLR